MDVPDLFNATTATVAVVPRIAGDGRPLALVVIKERFYLAPNGRLSRMGDAEVRYTDEPWDPENPATSSTRRPADTCIHKPSTDVLVAGYAMLPGRRPVSSLDVLVEVGPVSRALRVTGPRVWYEGAAGLTLTEPEPFVEVPLQWELAWGGTDASDESQPPLEEARNPVGRGVARRADSLVHRAGPQIEDPAAPITEVGRHEPWGVAPIARHWSPRRAWAGTMDAAWMRSRMPLPPLDLDPRFEQVATPPMVTPGYLRGGERVRLHHLCADGALEFELPRMQFSVLARRDDGDAPAAVVLDTVLLEPHERAVELTWRALVGLPRPARRLIEIRVDEKELR